MPVYALAVFLSSFLLFLVQPLIGKYILPWFGGTPGVWTACLLFFQIMLLAGYGYAHLLASWLTPRRQVIVHGLVLLATLVCLPIVPSDAWKSTTVENPTLAILLLLTMTVGGPYLVLSASAPLVQKWFSLSYPARSPYRLYAISNAASLGALLSYPFVFERLMQLPSQCYFWSLTYVGYAVSLGICAYWVFRGIGSVHTTGNSTIGRAAAPSTECGTTSPAEANAGAVPQAPSALDQILWIALSACGTLMLMATTNQITQDVAPIPFLWVLPLTLYLLSFVICFDHPRWYHRNAFAWLFIGMVVVTAMVQVYFREIGLSLQIAKYALCLFACCMVCHGELVLRRPSARWLTKYYLLISFGGSLGGCFVALAAPALFDDYREYWLGLGLTCLLVLVGRRYDVLSARFKRFGMLRLGMGATGAAASLAVVVGMAGPGDRLDGQSQVVAKARNFYGTLKITRTDLDSPSRLRTVMSHGTTRHGFQYHAADRAESPTAYFDRRSGIGIALESHPRRAHLQPMRIGVIGLGVGTLAAYTQAGDSMSFYEINPLVEKLCNEHFTFLRDAHRRGATVDVTLGDGRLLLEQQLKEQDGHRFDLLVVDAFSSDSVPVHLLTQECFETYWNHLATGGVLAVHISNLYLELRPVVLAHAAKRNAHTFFVNQAIEDTTVDDEVVLRSAWMLITFDDEAAARLEARPEVERLEASGEDPLPLWTDNYSSLYEVLR